LNDDAVGNGRDQFHPWLSVGRDGSVNVIFYDRRNDPANYRMDLYFTQSLDGGLTFSPNERVTTVSSDPNAGLRAGLIGEYNGLAALNAGRVHPIWTDTRDGDQDTYTAVIGGATAAEGLPAAAAGLRLAAATPNPFRDVTQVSFAGAAGEQVGAAVYDATGRRLRRLSAGALGGSGTLVWDGRDEQGRAAQSGLYFIRVEDGAARAAARVLLLR
jgi:hypothetical protein